MRFLGLGLAAAMLTALLMPQSAHAQTSGCTNVSSFGAVKLFLPDTPVNQDFAIWLRVQSPAAQARVLLDVNSSACLDFQAIVPAVDQWSWQAYKQVGNLKPIRFSQSVGNTIQVIGVQAGVKIDKVLLTEPDCVPVDFGANCKSGIEASGVNETGVTSLPPPSSEPVSGKFVVSDTPFRLSGQLLKLQYIVDGRTVQASGVAEPFDTSRIPNGKHTITIETLLRDGTSIREATIIEVDNLENILSPVLRWIKLNQSSLALTAIAIIGMIILLLFIGGIRRWYIKRRQLRFHGF